MIAFLGSFIQYLLTMVLLGAIGVAGVIAGKKLRERKDAGAATISTEDKR